MTNPLNDKERLDGVVAAIQHMLADPIVRKDLSQRAVQCKVWHMQGPVVASVLSELRSTEEEIRRTIMQTVSQLVYRFHDSAVDATMARAGIKSDPRIHAGSSLNNKQQSFDVFCLDSKERLYMLIKQYGWLEDFFRLYPIHFYENSFAFVHNIPDKELPCKVKVIGLGIGGSIACSGLAKNGIAVVHGYEKRPEVGPRSVTSRYQNASWRAYDIAAKLVDDSAYETLITNRQRINVKYDDGTEAVVTSDRVQIIIGSAIQSALQSAKRYGANLFFEANNKDYYGREKADTNDDDDLHYDIVALFCGAHTSNAFNGLAQLMHIYEWTDLDSKCIMWLKIKESDKVDAYCTRGGEIGAEIWHYTIESARDTFEDLQRIRFNQLSQYQYKMKRIENGINIGMTKDELNESYTKQQERLEIVMKEVGRAINSDCEAKEVAGQEQHCRRRFDYIFTNAPDNEHNLKKRKEAENDVVLDGEYTVEIKLATNCVISELSSFTMTDAPEKQLEQQLLRDLDTDTIVCGGDACVPPNPLAAYGATLACEAAGSLVQLAVAIGHVNAILDGMKLYSNSESAEKALVDREWIEQVKYLKSLFPQYYEAHARSENYFQWVQTLICNLYSLPNTKQD